jgi:hypothetical protein
MTGVLNHLIDVVFSLPMFLLAASVVLWRMVLALIVVYKVLNV